MNGSRQRACPDAETMAAFVSEELTRLESRLVRVHLDECVECREGVARLGRGLKENRQLLDRPEFGESRRSQGRWRLVAVAAVLLLGGGAAFFLVADRSVEVARAGVVLMAQGVEDLGEQGDGYRLLELGESLLAGTRLQFGAGGRLLLLCEDGLRRGKGVGELGKVEDVPEELMSVVDAFRAAQEDREERVLEIRGRHPRQDPRVMGGEFLVLYPAGEVAEYRPDFVWRGEVADGVEDFLIVVEGGGEAWFRMEVGKNGMRRGEDGRVCFSYPEGERALLPGRRYEWFVRSLDGRASFGEVSFYVLSDEERARLRFVRESLAEWLGDALARDMILLSFVREENLVGETTEILSRLIDSSNPVSKSLYLEQEKLFCRELLGF